MTDGNMDWLARVDWKFACSVGTSGNDLSLWTFDLESLGTPFPYINRVFFDDGIANYDLADWKKVIDPMLDDNNTL